MISTADGFILDVRGALHFFDTRSANLPVEMTTLQVWNLIIAEPLPLMKTAFRIRDAVASRFGVKRIGGFSGVPRETVSIGDRLDFFLVEHVEPNALVLTERDRHLDVMTSIQILDKRLTITSSVITHNAFGRLYMLPVGPAHKLIVSTMLKRLQRKLVRPLAV